MSKSTSTAVILSHPARKPLNLSKMRVADLCPRIRSSFDVVGSSSLLDPYSMAVEFYALNHMCADLVTKVSPLKPLDKGTNYFAHVERYSCLLSKAFRFLLHYTLIISAREARHTKNGSDVAYDLKGKYPQAAIDCVTRYLGSSNQTKIILSLQDHTDFPEDCLLGDYISVIEQMFLLGKFAGGYGGLPWANIAGTVRKMVYGEISPEVFIDTAFTLAHNNGPMFNKGMLFSHPNTKDLLKVLDIQRAGLIPHAINRGVISGFTYKLDPGSEYPPSDFSWLKVQLAGAVQDYTGNMTYEEKKIWQQKKDEIKAAKEAEEAAKKAEKLAHIQKLKEEEEKKKHAAMIGEVSEKVGHKVAEITGMFAAHNESYPIFTRSEA